MDIGTLAAWASVGISCGALIVAIRADRNVARERSRNAVQWESQRDPRMPQRIFFRNIGTETAVDPRITSGSIGRASVFRVHDGGLVDPGMAVSFELATEEERSRLPDTICITWLSDRGRRQRSRRVPIGVAGASPVDTP